MIHRRLSTGHEVKQFTGTLHQQQAVLCVPTTHHHCKAPITSGGKSRECLLYITSQCTRLLPDLGYITAQHSPSADAAHLRSSRSIQFHHNIIQCAQRAISQLKHGLEAAAYSAPLTSILCYNSTNVAGTYYHHRMHSFSLTPEDVCTCDWAQHTVCLELDRCRVLLEAHLLKVRLASELEHRWGSTQQ